ncbi:kinetochore protein Spc24 [Protopterus annectens]|uniref:kinetochore protein Spc24 n=1 Tax=Protopterus annectens TaxID=7888 RepID=UPI001CF9718B|nr:kinetochore protein Spc24 [Protopterus annectens]XP_043940498.1 kinetochore protein Spc24 [Protopterus annectens]
MEQLLEDYALVEEANKEITMMLPKASISLVKRGTSVLTLLLEWIVNTAKHLEDIDKAFKEREKQLAEKLIRAAEEKDRSLAECQSIEQELEKAKRERDDARFELQCLLKELEDIKEMEEEAGRLQQAVDEDTTTTIPSAVYIAQLYHKVTKIRWDFDSDPSVIKGIHYGPDVAQPINIDSTQHSKSFICDHLWSLVSTEW